MSTAVFNVNMPRQHDSSLACEEIFFTGNIDISDNNHNSWSKLPARHFSNEMYDLWISLRMSCTSFVCNFQLILTNNQSLANRTLEENGIRLKNWRQIVNFSLSTWLRLPCKISSKKKQFLLSLSLYRDYLKEYARPEFIFSNFPRLDHPKFRKNIFNPFGLDTSLI